MIALDFTQGFANGNTFSFDSLNLVGPLTKGLSEWISKRDGYR
jgi:hypothetical protein